MPAKSHPTIALVPPKEAEHSSKYPFLNSGFARMLWASSRMPRWFPEPTQARDNRSSSVSLSLRLSYLLPRS